MNRKQRRQQLRSKSFSRRAGVTYFAVAGLAGGSIGIVSPANAVEPLTATNCVEANSKLLQLSSSGGVLNLNFTSECALSSPYSFSQPSTINGPANGLLTLVAEDGSLTSLTTGSRLEISNLNFTVESVPEIVPSSISSLTMTPGTIPSFIFGAGGSDLFINNVEFHDALVSSSAINVEGNLTVADSAFTRLTSGSQGPAIFNSAGNTEVINTTFTSNSTQSNGGAVYAGGPLTVTGSIFDSNSSNGSGGAVYSGGALTVTGSTFESNEVRDTYSGGGAIYASSNNSIQNSTFKNNTSPGWGGAVNTSGTLSVANSSFDSNASLDAGGGAFTGWAETSVQNSTFVNNNAQYLGAMYSEGGGVVSNSTFWQNSNDDSNSTAIDSFFPVSFFANILADEKPFAAARFTDLGANLVNDPTFTPATVGEGASQRVTLNDLKLSALFLNQTSPVNTGATNTVALGAGSVARDFYSENSPGIDPDGNGGYFASRLSATDQRGVARPNGARYDVGAFEADGTASPSPSASPSSSPSSSPSPSPIVPAKATIAKQRIAFAPGSSNLSSASKKRLRTLAKEIQTKGLKSINVNGYTATLNNADPIGRAFRAKLSTNRAAAVERYLKQQFKKSGYKVTFRLSPKGVSNPVKSNKTEQGRIANRRVEITVN